VSDAPRFTRRDVLGGVAAASAGLLIGPAAAHAGEPQRGRVFSRWVGSLSGQTPALEAARSFALAGVQWMAPATSRIELRTRVRGGAWGPWAPASVQGHEPDRRCTSRGRFGEPLWIGRADQFQLRASRPVDGVRVHFVAASSPVVALASAASFPLAAPVLPAGPGQPPIIAREAWAGSRARPGGGPYYGSVQLAFVHHTDNPNGYSAGAVPAILLAIFDYHRYVRGFYDIAYNFIIDAFGRIWEARAGGIDEPVIGAHAGGFNEVSTGVAVLGTFMSSVPPAPAIEALQRLLAWKLSLHGVPVLGRVTVEVDPADAFYTPFAPGQRVPLPRVAGHRDGDLTDCPGDAFYARLPSIRPGVATLAGVPARLTLSAASVVVAPATLVALGGSLTLLHGPPIAAAPVEIQTVSGAGQETTVATVTTGADGSWNASLMVDRSSVLRALHRLAPASVSDLVSVAVAPVLTLTLSSSSPPMVSGTIDPDKASVTIVAYELLRNGHRRLIGSRRVAVEQGAFTARPPLGRRRPGRYVVIATTTESDGTLAGESPPLRLTI
jgi:hypothetical protein